MLAIVFEIWISILLTHTKLKKMYTLPLRLSVISVKMYPHNNNNIFFILKQNIYESISIIFILFCPIKIL